MAGDSKADPIRYYDCTASSSDDVIVTAICTDSDSASTAFYTDTNSGFNGYVPRQVLIEMPEHYEEEDVLALARLVNVHTKTGWVMGMIIMGKIIITDPRIERRTLKDFLPLLRRRASPTDLETIARFFGEHPLDEPT